MEQLSSPSSKQNGLFRRFMTWFLDFTTCRDGVFRFIWMILTFGYAYPRRRVGENFMYCILRHVVIFFSRLFCIIGAIYYMYRWINYAAAGDQRELTTLKRETKANETLVPFFTILSTEPNKINVTSVSYSSPLKSDRVMTQSTRKEGLRYGMERIAVFINSNLSTSDMGHFEVTVQHQSPLPAYPWFRINLFSPPKLESEKKGKEDEEETEYFSDQDLFNQYYYQPGHYVEILYTPTEVHSPPLNSSNIFTQIKNFAGFGDEVVTYSYESAISFKPFPASVAAQKGYTNETTVIILRPQASLQFIYYREEKTNFRDTMSSIGGLLSLAGSVIAFLFGAGLLSPWGKLVEMPFFRRKVAGSLAKAYASKDGISKGPFTGRIEDIGKFDQDMASHETRITLLKERMDELELVLTEYYLEGDIFQDYASERLQLKREKREALARAASTRPGVAQGEEGGAGGQDIPLLPSRKMDEYRRQSISGNHHRPNLAPLGHSRKFSDSAYPQRQQPLSPPLPLPQSRSSFYGTKQGGGRHRQSSSEQSLLRHSDQYSPNRASDETVNNSHENNQSMVSLLDQQGQPMYQASPMSPTYQFPSHQQLQHSRYSSSSASSSPASPPLLTPGYFTRPKDEFTQFSVIHEVSGEVQPPSETTHGSQAGGAGARDSWWGTTTDASSNGDNMRLSQHGPHQRYSGQGAFEMDMSDMPRES
ncbi:hypothetical protein BG006_008778 [Podila minutissima]|uniref:Uncharacterized protein n=1 Tax=Podila minutissima TaxID=64525 RepID=A0A9P5SJ83_9FUNG|nr:hypothetical protein BG006_008778 [Podila minutissima]